MKAINEYKFSLIDMIMSINNIEELKSIYKVLNNIKSPLNDVSSLENATVEVKKGVSIDEIYSEQNLDQISYQEIREIADDEGWEYSLEELLAEID